MIFTKSFVRKKFDRKRKFILKINEYIKNRDACLSSHYKTLFRFCLKKQDAHNAYNFNTIF